MSAMSLLFSFVGCSINNANKKAKNTSQSNGQLSSVSISQSHMDRTCCYSFWARENNGSFLLDAECMIVDYDNNDCNEISFSDTEITEEDFKQFTELDSKYDFRGQKKAKKKYNPFFICDETITSFSVGYGEESFSIETNGECFSAVHDCFSELAQKYA